MSEQRTVEAVRQRRGAAAVTLDVGVHRANGRLECPHAPDEAAGVRWQAVPGVWVDAEGVHRDTTYGALLCPLCAALFDQTGGRPV